MFDPGSAVAAASEHRSDRWLYAWALGYAAIGAASLLVPLYAIELGADPFVASALEATAGLAGVPGRSSGGDSPTGPASAARSSW
ncbi:hypothetical protein ACFQJD_16205 [Haloplanus sp. GCM10025708]|uniref:hypothetical protein n=1 Tax=Haloplanus sp. GCM10025708 TaxID=3252679 RepID=UPI00361F932C